MELQPAHCVNTEVGTVYVEEPIEVTASAKRPVYDAVSGTGAESCLHIALEGGVLDLKSWEKKNMCTGATCTS